MSELKVLGTNGGALRICLANPYQRILYFSLKTMFCVLKLHDVLLKAPPLVLGTYICGQTDRTVRPI
jgi:hypothetical protein